MRSESEILLGDDLPKRIMNVTTKKKLFSMTSKPYNTSFKTSKNLRRFPQIAGNRTQNGYHSGQYQKPYNNSHSNSSKHQNQREIKYGKSTWI